MITEKSPETRRDEDTRGESAIKVVFPGASTVVASTCTCSCSCTCYGRENYAFQVVSTSYDTEVLEKNPHAFDFMKDIVPV